MVHTPVPSPHPPIFFSFSLFSSTSVCSSLSTFLSSRLWRSQGVNVYKTIWREGTLLGGKSPFCFWGGELIAGQGSTWFSHVTSVVWGFLFIINGGRQWGMYYASHIKLKIIWTYTTYSPNQGSLCLLILSTLSLMVLWSYQIEQRPQFFFLAKKNSNSLMIAINISLYTLIPNCVWL